MSVAHRFGAQGYAVALVSRSDARHPEYLRSLADAGVEAAAFTADADQRESLRRAVDAARTQFGRIDVGYFGPAALGAPTGDITSLDAAGAELALRPVVSAVDFASQLIPELTARGSGALLFAGGLSSVVPMPPLGGLALYAAALRNYAITLNAALAPAGVYAGTITIGGLIDRGDIHRAMQGNPDLLGGTAVETLNPDDLAETVWKLYNDGNEAEAVVNALRV
jgi:NAD(P)-dependent dehydrogenase (short-subunit alcohol dehydrogenase family)